MTIQEIPEWVASRSDAQLIDYITEWGRGRLLSAAPVDESPLCPCECCREQTKACIKEAKERGIGIELLVELKLIGKI